MIRVERFRREDVYLIELQDAQKDCKARLYSWEQVHLFEQQTSFSIFNESNEVIFIGGFYEIYPGRSVVWSFFSKNACKYFIAIFRAIKKAINDYKCTRIEAYVIPNFDAGHRLTKLLQFKYEARLEAFLEDGQTADIYSLVRY